MEYYTAEKVTEIQQYAYSQMNISYLMFSKNANQRRIHTLHLFYNGQVQAKQNNMLNMHT